MTLINTRWPTLVTFDGDRFECEGKTYEIYGYLSVNIDTNELQLRDDIWINEVGRPALSFHKILKLWDKMHKPLIRLVKNKHIHSPVKFS